MEEKETKRQFEEKEGLRDPPLLEFLDPTLRIEKGSSEWKRKRQRDNLKRRRA